MISITSTPNNALCFKNFSFIYGNDKNHRPAISDVSFDLKEGEILILAGPSGSGKSTLSYAMSGLVPWRLKGFMKGKVEVFGKSVWDYEFKDLCKIVGLVKQNPLDQMVTFTVRDEIAFGLENLQYPKNEIEDRIDEISKLMGIDHLLNREIEQLSGGQKQLTILSSFLVMKPKILILDEPIAFLDQQSESLLLDRLHKLTNSKEFKLALIIIEHRLSRVANISDKIIVLNDNGSIALKGKTSDILSNRFDDLKSCNVRVPWVINAFNNFKRIHKTSNQFDNITNFQSCLKFIDELNEDNLKKFRQIIIENEIKPTTLKRFEEYEQIIKFGELYVETLRDKELGARKTNKRHSNAIIETRNLEFEYPDSKIKAIKNLSITIQKGDFIGLIGPNGSGKTTLLYLLANLYEPTSGEIFFDNQNLKDIDPYTHARNIGFIFQNPENMIFKPTIKEELLYGPRNFGILKDISENYLSKLINLIGNESLTKNPFKLSWGQKRRLNLGSVFIYNPEIILLDEPFIGQDQRTIDSLIETLYIENKRGKTIIISSHDYHLLLKYTKRIIELNKDGTLRDYDEKSNYFKKHKNLGPIILLDKINDRLNGAE